MTEPATRRFRPLVAADQDRLWQWLHVALWDPPPAGPRPLSVLAEPGVRIYAEGWGRPGDVGVVAVVGAVDAGACWMRLLPPGSGLAFVDEQTPQLGIRWSRRSSTAATVARCCARHWPPRGAPASRRCR
jgi:hypothetical protein